MHDRAAHMAAVAALASHPLKLYQDLGVRVTVNTDNRLITDTTSSRELWLCHSQMGLDPRDISRIIISGFKSAFLPFHIKQVYLRRVAAEGASVVMRGSACAVTGPNQRTPAAPRTCTSASGSCANAGTRRKWSKRSARMRTT